jgi:predicted transcriptional regulator
MQAAMEIRKAGMKKHGVQLNAHVKRYRNRFEIASTILHVVMDGDSTKTKLMYGSFLSFAQINEYLSFLLANELINKERGTRVFTLTEKGVSFLRVYEELSSMVRPD